HRDEDDLSLARLIFDAERLLDGMRIERVERPLARPVEPLGSWVEALVALRDLLDADGDPHRARTLSPRREAKTQSDSRVTLRPFEREPELMTRHRTTARGLLVLLAMALATGSAAAYASSEAVAPKVPQLIFPVVGKATYINDFGAPRGQGRHEGNDIMTTWRSPAVAVEAGKVKFHTTSARAGCMLYLDGVSGTTYVYIHLNNDLTAKNDNKGKCVS